MADEQASSSKSGAGKGTTVSTAFPYGSFEGEGFPTITAEGTKLTAAEVKAAQEAAVEHGVTLVVEDGS
jgi:hypothetical protein